MTSAAKSLANCGCVGERFLGTSSRTCQLQEGQDGAGWQAPLGGSLGLTVCHPIGLVRLRSCGTTQIPI